MTESKQPAGLSKSAPALDTFAAIRKAHKRWLDADHSAIPAFEAAHALQALHHACDPTTIASLLAAADRVRELEADARRYRWLRDEGSLTWAPFRAQWRMTAAECDSAIDREQSRIAAIDRAQGEQA